MIGRLRLWSGYALFAYVVTHLLNHTLGLISLRVLESARSWFIFFWHSPVGQIVLYGALATHLALALWSLYQRRSLKLSTWEWAQWGLGALIIPLGTLHVVIPGALAHARRGAAVQHTGVRGAAQGRGD